MRERIQGPRSGKMGAWHAAGADVAWYPIEAMRWPNVPVVVSLGGAEVLAVVRMQARTKRWWWVQLGCWGDAEKRWLRHQEIPLEMVGRNPPTRKSPTAWRPADPAIWRHPLPEPLSWPAMGPNRAAEPPQEPLEPIDPHLSSDGWPHPGLRLGLGVPASREECEARVLRAFRTSASRAGGGSVGHRAREICADIPKEIVLASVRRNELWWSIHPDADGSVYQAVRSGWAPSKRDIADWVEALGWLNGFERRSMRVIALRAADPPWSFRQIAERIGVKRNVTAKAVYERAIDQAFEAALQTTTRPRAGSGVWGEERT